MFDAASRSIQLHTALRSRERCAGPLPTGARTWAPEDVIGQCRTTVLKGESDFRARGATSAAPSGGGAARETAGDARRTSISIVGCHECSVYVLAPLQSVLISNCGHSTFVVRPFLLVCQQMRVFPVVLSVQAAGAAALILAAFYHGHSSRCTLLVPLHAHLFVCAPCLPMPARCPAVPCNCYLPQCAALPLPSLSHGSLTSRRAPQIGACGRSLRVERCANATIIAAASRLTIANCTDCTFHLAVNSQPLLAGDNRFVQLAPFNTSYQHIKRHLSEAGVARSPVHWSDPLELSRDPYQVRPARALCRWRGHRHSTHQRVRQVVR